MIIFLYGPDSYRLSGYAQELQNRYRSKYSSGFNLITCDGNSSEVLETLQEALKSRSFFDEVKLIVIKNPFIHKTIAGNINTFLREQDAITRKDIVVLLHDPRPGKELKTANKDLFELASRKGNTTQEFEYLTGSALQTWIKKEGERQQCVLSPAVIMSLTQRVGSDTWQLAQEITKLANYRGAGSISLEDVALLVSTPEDLNIFDLVDAFATRNKLRSYTLLYQELQSGRDPYYILTMLTYQARNLLIVHDLMTQKVYPAEIAQRAGLHPFVARKTIEQAKKFTNKELSQLYISLAETEHRTKQGTISLGDHLYLLCTSIVI